MVIEGPLVFRASNDAVPEDRVQTKTGRGLVSLPLWAGHGDHFLCSDSRITFSSTTVNQFCHLRPTSNELGIASEA